MTRACEVIDGVRHLQVPPGAGGRGPASATLYEFAYSLAAHRAGCRRRCGGGGRFDVIQACNPPDTYWLLARCWRRRGVRFVFDQHDLNPELFLSRFGAPAGLRPGRSSRACAGWSG